MQIIVQIDNILVNVKETIYNTDRIFSEYLSLVWSAQLFWYLFFRVKTHGLAKVCLQNIAEQNGIGLPRRVLILLRG